MKYFFALASALSFSFIPLTDKYATVFISIGVVMFCAFLDTIIKKQKKGPA